MHMFATAIRVPGSGSRPVWLLQHLFRTQISSQISNSSGIKKQSKRWKSFDREKPAYDRDKPTVARE